MTYQTVNPYTNELVKSYDFATDQEIDATIEKAHEAFLTWRTTGSGDRSKVLTRAAELLRADKSALAEVLTLEMGKITAEAEAEVELSAEILDYYADRGVEFLQDEPLRVKDASEGTVTIVHEPLGVLYAIEPWNFPYYQVVRIAAAQILAGNTIVLKHAENVPASALAMQRLFDDAGLPEGVFNNLFAPITATDHILAHPLVRGVALTGSERAGTAVAAAAGKNLKKSTLELGGADAFIVLADADIDKTVAWAVVGRHWNAGQVCVSAKRLIVVDSVYEEFLAKYRSGVAGLRAGDPLDPATQLAPLSTQKAADNLAAEVKLAVDNGATAETLGEPVPTQGAFYQPTILTDVKPDNPAFQTEFFGPVSLLFRVADEDEAIEVANASRYGLGGSVFTRDVVRGERVARRVETGMVFVNHPTMVKADIPFGGVKVSGYGNELTELGIREFVTNKVVGVVDIDALLTAAGRRSSTPPSRGLSPAAS
jgi:succinate-semialdehyde dehydrogenase/glutarate-semialdehyde dehydrogenase